MSEFITLSCPTCSGKLQITEDIDRFACIHCGNEHVVKRGGGIVSLKPVLEQVSKGVDNTASELALVRLAKEIEEIDEYLSALQEENIKGIGYYMFGVFLAVAGLFLLFNDCVGVGVVLILLAVPVFYYTHQNRLKSEQKIEKILLKRAKLVKSRKTHYDRVNKG